MQETESENKENLQSSTKMSKFEILQKNFQRFQLKYTQEGDIEELVPEFIHLIESIIIKQKNPNFFEFLIEMHILEYFFTLLKKLNDNHDFLIINLIKSFCLLITNTKNIENTFYIISHQIFNQFLKFDFNFKNEEVVFYFINFLKSISQKFELFPIEIFYNLVF